MNKWFELLLGLILVIIPIVLVYYYPYLWSSALMFLAGAVMWGVLCLGLLFILLGISDLKG